MKAAILTFHFARNYGAVLQCYALQEFLRSRGHDVSVLDYRPSSVADGYKVLDLRRCVGRTPSRFVRKTRSEVLCYQTRKRRFAAFEQFLQSHLRLAAPVDGGFDAVVCGSDQIWNTDICGGFDPYYWGDVPRGWGSRLIGYAASLENCVPDMAVAQEKLRNFSSASVREKKAAEALGLDLPACCDPVFLMDREFWSKLADESSVNIAKPYLFVYQVRYSDQFLGRVKDLAAARGLELVVLSAKVEQENSPCVAQAGPADFVKLIRDASVVMTNSFHGTALSIIFGKEYYSPRMDDGKDSRVENLLRTGADVKASVEFLKSCGL